MEREEAEAIYDQGREAVVAVLLRMDEQIARLEKRVAQQDERIARLERQASARRATLRSRPARSRPRRPSAGEDPSGRKPGGQRGHEGKGRPLLPAWGG